jgi:glycine oxidase
MNSDSIIVGGGIIGLLTAFELCVRGQSVQIIERGQIGREASWAGGGILAPLYPWRAPESLYSLAQWSHARYATLAAYLSTETGIDPEWTCSGLLVLEDSEHEAALSWGLRVGRYVEHIPASQLHHLEAVAEASHGALWLPEIAQIRNPRLLRAIKNLLIKKGVNILEYTEVRALYTQGDYVLGVVTATERHLAENTIIAGGAWSSHILGELGLGLEVVPIRGQMVVFEGPAGHLQRILLKNDCYAVPRRDGNILVGSTLESSGYDKSLTDAARHQLHQDALALAPSLARFPIRHHWAGLRPATFDGIPFIGPHPKVQGLFLNTGHFRVGLACAPASARLLVDLMLGQAPIVSPAPFAPARPHGSADFKLG